MKSNVLLDAYCKELRLPTALREYSETARRCAAQNLEYALLLQDILELGSVPDRQCFDTCFMSDAKYKFYDCNNVSRDSRSEPARQSHRPSHTGGQVSL